MWPSTCTVRRDPSGSRRKAMFQEIAAQSKPLIEWSEPVKELVGFLALFLGAGAIGFRYFALRGRRIETDRSFYDEAARRAAWMGLAGTIISLVTVSMALPGLAARKHLATSALLTSD